MQHVLPWSSMMCFSRRFLWGMASYFSDSLSVLVESAATWGIGVLALLGGPIITQHTILGLQCIAPET